MAVVDWLAEGAGYGAGALAAGAFLGTGPGAIVAGMGARYAVKEGVKKVFGGNKPAPDGP